jgi:cardiolipin synthase
LPGHFFFLHAARVSSAHFPDCRLGAHVARWLPDGDAAFAAMRDLVAAARESVCLEIYLVRPGEPATSLLAEFLAARARGVAVRVLYDAFGCESLDAGFFAPLVAAGGEVRVFSPARRLRLALRDHRKLLVRDRSAAIVGGMNLGPEYLGDGVQSGWYDLGLALEGPACAALADSFDAMWELAPMNAGALRRFRHAAARVSASAWTAAVPGRLLPQVALLSFGAGWPGRTPHSILRDDLARVRNVACISAYFLPPARVRRALRTCVRRGGEVQLVLAGRTDVAVALYAAQHLYPRLLAAGVRISEYQPQVLHAKLMVLDDTVYVGSCNLDRRSLYINYELLLRLDWPELAAQARAMIAGALEHGKPLDPRQWGRGRGVWQRWRSRLAYWLLTRIDPLLARRPLRALD